MKDLTKAYDGKLALDGLHLEIREGDIFGYIGPNGAGKTTTLRILAALLLPTRGSAEIAGVDVGKVDSIDIRAYKAVVRMRIRRVTRSPAAKRVPRTSSSASA